MDIRHSADAKKMVALYDYDPHEHSPHLDNEVSCRPVFEPLFSNFCTVICLNSSDLSKFKRE